MTAAGRAAVGAVYDGNGGLVAGEGPAFSVEMVAGLAFQAVLHDLDEPGTVLDAGDRLWVLPEHGHAERGMPEHVLAALAATVRAGRKVLVMAHDAEAGNGACDAIERMLDTPHGSA